MAWKPLLRSGGGELAVEITGFTNSTFAVNITRLLAEVDVCGPADAKHVWTILYTTSISRAHY